MATKLPATRGLAQTGGIVRRRTDGHGPLSVLTDKAAEAAQGAVRGERLNLHPALLPRLAQQHEGRFRKITSLYFPHQFIPFLISGRAR
jgi:hypothetical protein